MHSVVCFTQIIIHDKIMGRLPPHPTSSRRKLRPEDVNTTLSSRLFHYQARTRWCLRDLKAYLSLFLLSYMGAMVSHSKWGFCQQKQSVLQAFRAFQVFHRSSWHKKIKFIGWRDTSHSSPEKAKIRHNVGILPQFVHLLEVTERKLSACSVGGQIRLQKVPQHDSEYGWGYPFLVHVSSPKKKKCLWCVRTDSVNSNWPQPPAQSPSGLWAPGRHSEKVLWNLGRRLLQSYRTGDGARSLSVMDLTPACIGSSSQHACTRAYTLFPNCRTCYDTIQNTKSLDTG